MGMNGLDVAGLRPFDLVIPFTIQKGEITGKIHTSAAVCGDDFCVVEFQRIVIESADLNDHISNSCYHGYSLPCHPDYRYAQCILPQIITILCRCKIEIY